MLVGWLTDCWLEESATQRQSAEGSREGGCGSCCSCLAAVAWSCSGQPEAGASRAQDQAAGVVVEGVGVGWWEDEIKFVGSSMYKGTTQSDLVTFPNNVNPMYNGGRYATNYLSWHSLVQAELPA